MDKQTIFIKFVGPEDSGKSVLEALFSKVLHDYGIDVALPPNPKRQESLIMSKNELISIFQNLGTKIMLMESQIE